jgi:hypothetical protein
MNVDERGASERLQRRPTMKSASEASPHPPEVILAAAAAVVLPWAPAICLLPQRNLWRIDGGISEITASCQAISRECFLQESQRDRRSSEHELVVRLSIGR